MDVDIWVRRTALVALPLVGLAIYFCSSDPPPPEPAPVASASAAAGNDGIPAPKSSSATASELGAKGEAALAQRTPEPEVPPPPRHSPRSRSAADLPMADDFSAGSDRSQPLGPCGGIEARLITLSEDKEWTFASLAMPGEPAAMKHEGDRIGSWRVDKIEWDRVWLRGAGRCAVGMHVGARAAADDMGGTPESPTVLDDTPARPPPWKMPHEIVTAIEKIAEFRYEIDRSIVGGLFERAGDLLAGMQIAPVRKNEEVTGISLKEIRQDSLLDRFGVKDGDMLVEINGEPCTTLDGTLQALDKARKSERLLASLDRVGKRYRLEVVAR